MIYRDMMHRIRGRSILEFSDEERLNQVSNLQRLRTFAIDDARANARSKAKVPTKSAARNKAKKGIKTKNPSAALAKLLKSMSPADVAKLLKGAT